MALPASKNWRAAACACNPFLPGPRENALSRDAVNDFLNEAIGQQRMPVKAHFNILAWTERPEPGQGNKKPGISRLSPDGYGTEAGAVGGAADPLGGLTG